MLIKPYAWSDVKPGAKTRGTHKPSIQIFAMTEDNKTVYIRIPAPSIYLLHLAPDKIPQRPTVIRYLASRFGPILIEDSVNNPAVLALIFAEPTEFEQEVLDLVDEPIFFRDDYVEWLLSHRRIEPYNWIELVDPQPLSRPGYTNCDYEFISDFRNLKRVPPPKPESLVDDAGIIYWDIEAQSSTGNFTEAATPGDFVTSISVLTSISGQLKGYVFISIGPVLQDRLKQYTVPFEVIECADETDLFNKYYRFLADLKPGIKIGYNDSFYDTPYLIDRDHLLKIKVPNMSHIRTYPARVMPISYPSPLPGTTLDRAKEYYLPDSENLDMVLYFRRYLPGLNNYKLETVSRYILGEGKTGLPYDEMFRIVRERDPEGILELIDYSFIDSVLLGQLEGEAGVLKSLNNLANDTGVLRQDLLRLSDDKLIESIFCRLDFGYLFDQISFEPTAHIRPLKEGIYQGLLSMDYKNLILEAFNQAFVQTDNKWIGILGLVSIRTCWRNSILR